MAKPKLIKLSGADARRDNALFEKLQKDVAGFEFLQKILMEWTGITMNTSSVNIVKMANRLSHILPRHGLSDYNEYAKHLRTRDPQIMSEFISAMTTNTTRFFRENSHFESLKNIVPEIVKRKKTEGKSEIRVWCAASSTGEEAYTLAMTLLETLPSPNPFKVKILATDIDTDALKTAAEGIYDVPHLKEIPPLQLEKYFRPHSDVPEKTYKVDTKVQDLIRFATFNLQTAKYPFQHTFDIIFCRNVLIYFTYECAGEVIDKLANVLGTDSYLFVGHSEVGYVRSPLLKMIQYGVYKKLTSERNT